MTIRVKRLPGDDAPRVSSPMGRGGSLDLVTLASETCRRYRVEFPDEKRRYGAAGVAWCLHDNQHLLNWAVETVNGELDMNHEVAWLASVLEARGFPLARLSRTLDIAAGVVTDELSPARSRRLARVLLDASVFVRDHGTFLEAS